MGLEKRKINLLVTIDNRYVEPLIVMLKSYITSNPNIETDLYIAHSTLMAENMAAICAIANKGNVNVKEIKIKDRWFAEIPVLERLPEESFYRLLAFHYLPVEVDKCLYLDPDTLIKKELLTLYDLYMDDYYVAAASHLKGYRNWINKKRLKLKKQKKYVNSGIMLMNLTKIRKDFSLEYVLECLKENVQNLRIYNVTRSFYDRHFNR